MRFARFLLSLPAGLPVLAIAAASAPVTESSMVGSMVQVVLALGLVLCLIMLAAWLMRRFSLMPRSAGGLLRVVSGVMVGQRERVVIVEVRDQWLVLGVTAQNVNLLSSMPKPEDSEEPREIALPFAAKLARALQKQMGKAKTPGQV
ncbi:MAG: flagellar biosynthetic protein FliO [Formivibrio sp.]|nr:flagellar biosynthetic protein FliO [Formivibrio sp.]